MRKKLPDLTEPRRLLRLATNPNLPVASLAALMELRDYLDRVEVEQVQRARAAGASPTDVAIALRITRQALAKRHPNHHGD